MNPVDDFRTSSEQTAYENACAMWDLVPTDEDNKRMWFEARDYFESVQIALADSGNTEATISYSELALRQQALSYASQNVNGENASSTVARAKAYLKFLQNGGEE